MVEPVRNSAARERFNISRLAIQYQWLTLGFWIAVAIAGLLAFSSLKYALFPDITFPVVVVNATAPLTDAVETEQRLTLPLENGLQSLERVIDVRSTTYPGRSVVRLHFEVGADLAQSNRVVEETLKTLDLPEGTVATPIAINLNEAAVASYAIESESLSLPELAEPVKATIIPAIARLPGVLKVYLLGEPTEFDLTQLAAETPSPGEGPTLVRFNGEEALAIQVVKAGDANTLDVVRRVEQEVQRLQEQNPALTFTLAATQAEYIEAATGETMHALMEAIILSVVVIYPFLWNWRSTVISALAIPMSLLGTFIVMAWFGFNLETITLLALAMVIGSIIDDAIVDVENIARHLENGESPKQAAILATNEIGLTVTAATMTAVAVFLPVGMMAGVLGQFFKPFGITISAAMITSLLVARTLSPLLAAYWLKPSQSQGNAPRWLRGAEHWFDRINRPYRTLLAWSLRHRGWIVAIALFSFVAGLALIPLIPKGFIPKLDRGEFNITYTAPLPQIPPELLAAPAGQLLPDQRPDDRALAAGRAAGRVAAGQVPTDLSLLEENSLAPASEGQPIPVPAALPPLNPLRDSFEVATELDTFVRRSPQVESVFTVVGSRQGEPNKGTIYVKLRGDRTLTTADVQDQFRRDLPRLEGVTTSVEDIQFVDTGGEKPVQVSIVGEDLETLNRTANDIQTRLDAISGLEDVSSTSQANQGGDIRQIERENGQRVATISANLGQGLTIGEATDRAVAEAQAVLPANISLKLGGDSARVDEILGSFGRTLILSVLCIVLVLLVLFRSVVDTIVIFLAIPLSIVGAMLGLLLAQSDFGMISLIGIIFLLGLTNKNAILIVDYIKQLRDAGKSRTEAILEAGPVRLRPIFMTTAATLLGMLPLAIGLGPGAELRAPMAIAIMGGLITSTLLSLIVVPVLYDLLDDWRSRLNPR